MPRRCKHYACQQDGLALDKSGAIDKPGPAGIRLLRAQAETCNVRVVYRGSPEYQFYVYARERRGGPGWLTRGGWTWVLSWLAGYRTAQETRE